jgi:hypothetical protein
MFMVLRTLFRPSFTVTFGFLLGLLAFTFAANAQQFDEGDWTVWGDARQINSFSTGLERIYVGTSAGVYRYDTRDGRWLDPWYSVPTLRGEAILLRNVVAVFEDALSRDVYVQLSEGRWLRRESTSRIWRETRTPDELTRQRFDKKGKRVKADPHWIVPFGYLTREDGTLQQEYLKWGFAGGIEHEFGVIVVGWQGFGLGVTDRYHKNMKLYPAGPGPSVGMARRGDEIWAAGRLYREGGWVWRRESGDPWSYFTPELEWGLEPARVGAIRIGNGGEVWMATDEGVMVHLGREWKWLRKTDGLPTARINDIVPVGNGRAWIATRFGLARIAEAPPKVQRPDREADPLGWSFTTALAYDGSSVYAGGPGLLLVRESAETPWRELTDVPAFTGAGEPPTAMYADGNWFAMSSERSFAWRAGGGEWKELFSQRWDHGMVLDIEWHAGFWWLGTDRGLVRLNPGTLRTVLYEDRDGLPDETIYSIEGDGDYLWLGTSTSLTRFHWKRTSRID